MSIRGVRGATAVVTDEVEAIRAATQELLAALMQANPTLDPADLASAFFTVTHDLRADYPALAARAMGWHLVPMLCAQEIPVPGGLPRCIRVLLHWNTELPQAAIRHVYLGEAASLRPDLAEPMSNPHPIHNGWS
jgi:chorismate mutase